VIAEIPMRWQMSNMGKAFSPESSELWQMVGLQKRNVLAGTTKA
jgi:hypothetical protein